MIDKKRFLREAFFSVECEERSVELRHPTKMYANQ